MARWLAASLALAALISFASLWFLALSLAEEGAVSMRVSAFEVIGDRAIQLSRIGRVGQTRSDNPRTKIPVEYLSRPESISCESNIVADEFDPLFETSAVVIWPGVRLSFSARVRIFLVYQGPPPDFAPFFTGSRAIELLGPLPYLDDGTAVEPRGAADNVTFEYIRQVRDAQFEWRSFECPHFSFTIFEGNKM